MQTNQIYDIVNAVNAQAMGKEAIAAVDTSSFVAVGDSVLSSSTNTEAFINTLVQRIGQTILSFRPYNSRLKEVALSSMEWGAILQKIKVEMPEAVEDVSVDLTDGESIDHYIIAKPKAKQKLFVIRSPYSFFVTIQRRWLREAFLGEAAMDAFISGIFGEVSNRLEVSQENLGRLTIANFIANTGASQKIHLLTEYIAASGDSTVTADTALTNNGFLRYAMGLFKLYSMRMEAMSVLYNKEQYARHTPIADQRFIMLADFRIALETQVEYAAFHTDYLEKAADIVVPYWQSADAPMKILIEDGDTEVEVDKVVAFIHDRDALGTFRKNTDVLTTPVNARGAYYNTFYHTNDARMNDLSENGIVFLLD